MSPLCSLRKTDYGGRSNRCRQPGVVSFATDSGDEWRCREHAEEILRRCATALGYSFKKEETVSPAPRLCTFLNSTTTFISVQNLSNPPKFSELPKGRIKVLVLGRESGDRVLVSTFYGAYSLPNHLVDCDTTNTTAKATVRILEYCETDHTALVQFDVPMEPPFHGFMIHHDDLIREDD